MILRKYMSMLGIGAANIDLVLEKNTYMMEELVYGEFVIKGGTIEQQLKRIECSFIQVSKNEKKQKIIESSTILTSRIIEPESIHNLPFMFKLPVSIEPSDQTTSHFFRTRLIFDEGIESKDQDGIKIIG
ncbi:sporulation protein [Peribacillus sp. B-H-3]|uniref:sporulation protein n=1 Tax=Peribacillus sp. B-H-3 TaxID=3400420 RepID=UPI003B013D37